MDYLTILNTIGTGAIAIGIYGFSKILPKYFEKKGENLAIRQDIQNLTKLVKDVEQIFIEKTEKLRHELDLHNQLFIGLHQEARNAIIKLHDAVYEYYNFVINPLHENVDLEDSKLVDQQITKNGKLFHSIEIASSRTILFLENKHQIEKITNEILSLLYKLNSDYDDYHWDIIDLNDEYITQISKNIREGYFDKRSNLQDNYLKNLAKEMDKIDLKLEEFSTELRNFLNANIKTD